MKKIISVVGARPNFMKVAPIHRAFNKYPNVEHLILHTGQHYDAAMSDAFFQDLDMPQPAYFMGVGSGSHAEQTAKVMVEFEKAMLELKPDFVIVVGDVNSTIACTLTSVKMGIPTAHVEAGLRSGDRGMPEEINRIATDSICDYWFVTEQSGLDNLLQNGSPKEKVFFVGNTMIDSLHYALPKADKSDILNEIGLKPKEYVLVTMHRPSNVDEPKQLGELLEILAELSKDRIVVFPVHPRTRKNIASHGLNRIIEQNPNIKLIDPQGYISFLAMMKNSDFVLTDSGGIQEETTALGVPCMTIRTTTERPITCEIGTNTLIEPTSDGIRKGIHSILNSRRKTGQIPPLWDGHASDRIAEIIVTQCLGL
ncbi:MAG: UDP-N-acetylglucosamine 2-epimerase (non-hydrolyzing) [Ignavibacteriae bacterium]|nr:UDP-N-acetylglucosamine 2-epimerase (non-hydrolyzing) [Ignavibacteriota bacterium]